MDLKTSLSSLSGIGPTFAKRLEYLNLHIVEDLINHYPFRYEDFANVSTISNLKIGESITVSGEIWEIKNTYTRFRKVLTKAILNDGSGTIEITWFNQPWLTKNVKTGDRLQVSGKVGKSGHKVTLVSPKWEKLSNIIVEENNTIHTGRLVPVYPETYGITSKWIRQKIAKILPIALEKISDPLPESVRGEMLALPQALSQIHFPEDFQQLKLARNRLAFDELFYIQLSAQKTRLQWQQKQIINPLIVDKQALENFIQNLPFQLTKSQIKVISEIVEDLQKNHPMNRLVQGDVGSGKTVVAAAIIYLTLLQGLQSVLMAPTEILAFQHFETLSKLLEPYNITVGIYTGSKKFTKNKELTEHNSPQVIVGTHALLSNKLELENVGLVVVDEQQRFGVEQRSLLRNKAKTPHFLTMTATPIPRTVALTLYGDLDLSVIDELPQGRKTVRTHFVPHKKRADAYNFIAKLIKEGQQIYIITPLIELSETNISAKAAKVEYERLKKDIFPDFKIGLLHGRLKSKEKEQAINEFKDHEIDILVSTSVVEVGVDVPNATIMVIEGAERFGLAQLHQLRGRVGRGSQQSYTLLFAEDEKPQTISRLKIFETTHDGLKLAELDLKIRGSGEFFGTAQSGRWDLKIASLSDLQLIEKSKHAAQDILDQSSNLDKYPQLQAKLTHLAGKIMPD